MLGLAVHLGGQMPAALGGILVERALHQVQGVVDLPFKLLLPEQQVFALPAHKYAYNYAHFKPSKPAGQAGNVKNDQKNVRKS